MNPVLFCWNLQPQRRQILRSFCDTENVLLRPVTAAECAVPLAALGQNPRQTGLQRMPFEDEMLLMAGFSDRQLDRLLRALRQEGMQTVRLKAVLTPHNASWDSLHLYRELSDEASRMSGGRPPQTRPEE